MSGIVANIISITFLIVIGGVGLFLLMYKKKTNEAAPYPKWFDKISPEAQKIHLKEWQKKTKRVFTLDWFLEYWQGERSAFAAWLTWMFLGGIAIGILCLPFKSILTHNLFGLITFKILLLAYSIMSSIILWKCARNSTKGFKYFARIVAVLSFSPML